MSELPPFDHAALALDAGGLGPAVGVEGERDRHHVAVVLAADAFAAALADYFAGRIIGALLHAAAQATAVGEDR